MLSERKFIDPLVKAKLAEKSWKFSERKGMTVNFVLKLFENFNIKYL